MLDPTTLELTYTLAGHEPPILFRKDAQGWSATILPGGGLVAGVIEGQEYAMESIQLKSGDLLLAYTDGITDAVCYENTRFGRDRLLDTVMQSLREHPERSATEVLEHVFWSLRQFSGLAGQADDETLVMMRIG